MEKLDGPNRALCSLSFTFTKLFKYKMTSWSYGSSENHRNERPVALICMISCQILLGHWPMNYDIRIGNYRRIMLAVSKQYEANIIMFADIFFFVEIMVLVDT